MSRPTYLSIPNALTLLRGLGVPLFIYLTLVLHADAWAIATLAIGGATDYFDGKLARAWGQTSRLGELMDPAIDRIYIAATLIVLYIRDAIPIWVIAVLMARDIALGALTVALKLRGHGPLSVSFLGKAATFNLMYAIPFLLLALSSSWLGTLGYIIGWSFGLWGIALYLATGIGYFRTGLATIRISKSKNF